MSQPSNTPGMSPGASPPPASPPPPVVEEEMSSPVLPTPEVVVENEEVAAEVEELLPPGPEPEPILEQQQQQQEVLQEEDIPPLSPPPEAVVEQPPPIPIEPVPTQIPDINIRNPTPSVSESGAVDWHALYVNTEADLQSSGARVAALERLLDSQNKASATKVKQLTNDLAKRNQRIKELEAAVKAKPVAAAPSPVSRKKSVDSNVSTAQAGVIRELEKRLKAAEGEKQRLAAVVNSRQVQGGGGGDQGGFQQQQLLLQARDAITELRKQLAEKDAAGHILQQKLSEAQTAILTNVEGISSLDSKLQQSRKALRWLLRQQGYSPSARSPSPNYTHQGVGNNPPAYSRSPSATPQHLLQQHDVLARSHLGHEQLTALRELEAMLAAREQQQHGY